MKNLSCENKFYSHRFFKAEPRWKPRPLSPESLHSPAMFVRVISCENVNWNFDDTWQIRHNPNKSPYGSGFLGVRVQKVTLKFKEVCGTSPHDTRESSDHRTFKTNTYRFLSFFCADPEFPNWVHFRSSYINQNNSVFLYLRKLFINVKMTSLRPQLSPQLGLALIACVILLCLFEKCHSRNASHGSHASVVTQKVEIVLPV